MKSGKNQLPSGIRRPLWTATLCILVFLTFSVLWAVAAPLATTVTLRGSIQSAMPSISLQHTYGGLVEDVFVEVHDTVAENQEILRIDTQLEQETLAVQKSIRDRLRSENREIQAILQPAAYVSNDVASPLSLRKQQLELQDEMSRIAAQNLGIQADALSRKIQHSEEQLLLMTRRAERLGSLTDQGLRSLTEKEHLQEQILLVRGEIEADRASLNTLQDQIERTRKQQDLSRIAFTHEVASKYQENLHQLDQLEGSILDLSDRIEKSILRAPIAGTIASLPIATEHVVTSRGETLVTLVQPLEQPRVSFAVPVDYIDQIRPGMTARLSIPSLPQRQMPKIDVTIEAISPRAVTDESGNPVSYTARAVASDNALEKLFEDEYLGQLSEDMPVILIVTVRDTTFADYLLSPFLSAFSKALQD